MTGSDQPTRGAKPQPDTEVLQGGVNQIIRSGNTVIRPAGSHTRSVHRVLRRAGPLCPGLPEPLAHDPEAKTETLTFVPGLTSGYPLRPEFRTDRALISAAALLRRFHDATADFEPGPFDSWDLPPRRPAEVICHGDFAPYNCVVNGGEVTGVFDFDTAHPGPRLWDIGYAAYRWTPLLAESNPDRTEDNGEQLRRLNLFCSAYRTDESMPTVMIAAAERLDVMVTTMRQRAADGHRAFARHVADGHDTMYEADIAHLRTLAAEHPPPEAGGRR